MTDREAKQANEWLNEFARETGDEGLYPEDDPDYEKVRTLANSFYNTQVHETDRLASLRDETALSDREAEVVAMKKAGLTHGAIALVLGLAGSPDSASPSSVDEYSRRAREKFGRAQRTVEELDDLYGESEETPAGVEFVREVDGRVTARHVESGVASFGDTEAEALRQLADALDSHFGRGEEIPDPQAWMESKWGESR